MRGSKAKIYGAVIGLGLLGLAIDQLTGSSDSTPATASAATKTTPDGSTAGSSDTPRFQVAVTGFPTQLPDPTTTFSQRDPFAMSTVAAMALSPTEDEADLEDSADPDEPAKPTAEEFLSRHRLSAVLDAGNRRVAIVDGLILRPGNALEDCELLQILDRSAFFQCRDGVVELTLENPLK